MNHARNQQEEPELIERRTFGITIKSGSLNEAKRSCRFVASTSALDSYNEIVDQDWDLTRYSGNPVVLYNHNRGWGPSVDTLPIGYAEDVKVVDGQLEATLVFVTQEASPLAEMVWQGVKQKSLRAVSVGFRSSKITSEERDGKEIARRSGNILFEISVVPMGANHQALAKALELELARRAHHQERTTMDVTTRVSELESRNTELQASVDTLRAESAAMKESNAQLTTKVAELTAQNTELTGQIATLTTAKSALEADLATAKKGEATLAVQALVGKKILPAEVNDYVELYLEKREKFDRQISNRPDLSSLGQKMIGADPQPKTDFSTQPSTKGLDEQIDTEIDRMASKSDPDSFV